MLGLQKKLSTYVYALREIYRNNVIFKYFFKIIYKQY